MASVATYSFILVSHTLTYVSIPKFGEAQPKTIRLSQGGTKKGAYHCGAHVMLVFAIAKGNILMGGVVLILPAFGDVQIIKDIIVSLWRLASSAVDLPAVTLSSVDLLVGQILVTLEGIISQ